MARRGQAERLVSVHLDPVSDEATVAGTTTLHAQAWWASDRDNHTTAQVLHSSDLVVIARDDATDEVGGITRVLTDRTYLAVTPDVR